MKIGELARLTGVKAETIRFYEKIGVLHVPDRTSGNYRDYIDEHVSRLAFVRQARDLGFELDDVRALLDLRAQEGRDAINADRVEELRSLVEAKIDALGKLLHDLNTFAATRVGR